jgi:hypothetical protein
MERIYTLPQKVILRLNETIVWPLKAVVGGKIDYLRARALRGFQYRKTILFYPQRPKTYHAVYKICHKLGYRIVNNPDVPADVVIRFEDTTFGKQYPVLQKLEKEHRIINGRCTNISKKYVDEVFTEVFGYSMTIDPTVYPGAYVQKSDINALHDGTVLSYPTEPKDGYVYQLLINNSVDQETVEDLRLLIVDGTIPFVTRRFKSIDDRFDITTGAKLAETNDVLSQEEIRKVIQFCTTIGLEYGEIDALRDRDTGLLYLIDVNNTPAGPIGPMYHELETLSEWFTRMARAFDHAFVQSTR